MNHLTENDSCLSNQAIMQLWSKIVDKNKINSEIGSLTLRTIASKNLSEVNFPSSENLSDNIVLDLNYSVFIPIRN